MKKEGYIKPIIVLAVICLVAGGLLGYVNHITDPIITEAAEIRAHEAEIESRPEDPEFTADWLKAENRKFMERFQHEEGFILIDKDYESRISTLLT